MIHRESWYREAGLEETFYQLERRVRGNDLDSLVALLRLQDRFPKKFSIKLLELYDAAHPGATYGTLYTLEKHLETRLDMAPPAEIEPIRRGVEEALGYLREACRVLGNMERFSFVMSGNPNSESFIRNTWKKAEGLAERGLSLYDSLLDQHEEVISP